MYCRYCGKEIPEEATVCPECGRVLKESPEEIEKEMKLKHLMQFRHILEKIHDIQSLQIKLAIASIAFLILALLARSTVVYLIPLLVISIISLINSIRLLITLGQNWKFNQYIDYGFITLLVANVISLINLGISTGYVGGLLKCLNYVFTILFYILITYAIGDYATEKENDHLLISASNRNKFFIIFLVLTVVITLLPINVSYKSFIVSILIFPSTLLFVMLLRLE